MKISKEQYESDIRKIKGIKFISFEEEWKGNKTKVNIQCDICKSISNISLNGIRGRKTATYCTNCNLNNAHILSKIISEDKALNMIKGLSNNRFEFLEWLEPYKGLSKQKAVLKCISCHRVWESNYNNLSKGKGCPSCAKAGFQQSKPGFLYIIELSDKFRKYIKYGIANNLSKRINQQSKNSAFSYKILHSYEFVDGANARKIESLITQEFKHMFSGLSKNDIKDGYTETLKYECLNELQKFIEDYCDEHISDNK